MVFSKYEYIDIYAYIFVKLNEYGYAWGHAFIVLTMSVPIHVCACV